MLVHELNGPHHERVLTIYDTKRRHYVITHGWHSHLYLLTLKKKAQKKCLGNRQRVCAPSQRNIQPKKNFFLSFKENMLHMRRKRNIKTTMKFNNDIENEMPNTTRTSTKATLWHTDEKWRNATHDTIAPIPLRSSNAYHSTYFNMFRV